MKLKPYPFKNGQSLEVVVTEVLSPWELWIQPADNGFNLLMEKMCMHFAKAVALGNKGGLTVPPSVGEYCCARFMDDDTWYRVCVIGLYQSNDKPSQGSRKRLNSAGSTSSISSIDSHYPGLEVEVLCVDDGNRERLPLSRLRHLDAVLADIPCQAVCCALAGVQPLVRNPVKSAGDSLWQEESIEWLRNKVSGVKLVAYPRRTDDEALIMVDLYLTNFKKTPGAARNIPGKDSPLPGQTYSIADIMVSEGKAQYVGQAAMQSSTQSSKSEGQPSVTKLLDVKPIVDNNFKQPKPPKVTQPKVTQQKVTQPAKVTQPKVTQPKVTPQKVTPQKVMQQKVTPQKNLKTPKNVQDKQQHDLKNTSMTKANVKHDKAIESMSKSDTKQLSTAEESVTKETQVTHGDGHTMETQEKTTHLDKPIDGHLDTKEVAQHRVREYCIKQTQQLELTKPTNYPLETRDKKQNQLNRDDVKQAPQSDPTKPMEQGLDMQSNVQDQVNDVDVTQEGKDDVKQDRVSPRHPPDGSSLVDSLPDLGNDISEGKPTSSKSNQNRLYLPRQDQPLYLQVMMSEVVSPSEFYVHLVTPEVVHLAELTEELDAHYKDTDVTAIPVNYRLSIGDYCCAKFSKENMWCRAKVLEVKVSPVGEDENSSELVAEIYVFYVDYGNSEWVAMGDTMPLLNKFMMLPGFAVRCQLAGVQPAVTHDDVPVTTNEPSSDKKVQDNTKPSTPPPTAKQEAGASATSTAIQPSNKTDTEPTKSQSRRSPKGKRGKKNKKLPLHDRNVVLRAAGDESGDSELSDGGLIFDVGDKDKQVKVDEKETEERILPEKYLMPSPDETEPPDTITTTITKKADWTEEAIELFKGLTGDDKPLRGVMAPWNARVYQQVYYPSASCTFVDITYERPSLLLQLYDTTSDEDVDIAQVLLEIGLAEPCEIPEMNGEDTTIQNDTEKTMHISVEELEKTALQLEKLGTCVSPVGSDDSDEVKFFDPMMEDFKSSRNAYKIDTNDLDIAIHGFKPIETQICRFYQSPKTRCWRGENCPFLHVKEGEDASVKVQAFCNNNDSTVDLPKANSWVGVRVTAVINPSHFWVHLPCGSGPIEKKIIEERLGLTTKPDADNEEEDEDFEAFMERMNKFYSRDLFRDSSSILPAPGELVAAKYSQNDEWYRGCVLDVMDGKFQVSFVDFGNTEWTEESNIQRMLPQFLHMPFQAVECFLGNVEPIEESGEWAPESLEMFESLTKNKLLIAHVLKISWNNTMWVELYDTQTDPEINISEEMIKEGFAVESDVKIIIPPSSPSNSVSSTGSDGSSERDIVFYPG